MAGFLFFTVLFSFGGAALGIALRMCMRSTSRDVVSRFAVLGIGLVGMVGATVADGPTWLARAIAVSVPLAVGLTVLYVRQHQRELTRLRNVASALRDFGLQHFDRLDRDGDKVITFGDLYALEQEDLGPGDKDMVKLMRQLLPQIGHCVDYTVIVGTVGGPATPVFHYGISRQDLEKYPSKAQSEYDEEFGQD